MDLMQIKIAKDEQIVSYIKLIREYDKSMSMSHIKQKIESNDFVVTYDTMVSFKQSLFSSYTFIGIITKNGDYVTIEKVNSDIEKIAVDSLLKNFPEFKNSVDVLKNVFSESFFKMLKEEFEKEVTYKKDFVEYCEL